jgi:hypothetical protein
MAATALMGAIFTFQAAPGFSLLPSRYCCWRLTHDLSRSVELSVGSGLEVAWRKFGFSLAIRGFAVPRIAHAI